MCVKIYLKLCRFLLAVAKCLGGAFFVHTVYMATAVIKFLQANQSYKFASGCCVYLHVVYDWP